MLSFLHCFYYYVRSNSSVVGISSSRSGNGSSNSARDTKKDLENNFHHSRIHMYTKKDEPKPTRVGH